MTRLQRYTRVLISLIIGGVARILLQPVLHGNAPFITLTPAVVYSAWVAGLEGGLVATLLSILFTAWHTMPPAGSLSIGHADQILSGRFAVVGAIISVLGQVQLRAREQADKAARREHAIASRLQDALQPDLPETLPGMQIAGYYRAALEESEIGGDFCDAVSLDKTITFLVVGDLSGKGLAAAAEVATIRNMLRFALYNGRTLNGPIDRLNATLAEHALIAGFATLFVARYDAHARTLTYVNCGQEPALLRRGETGVVEEMTATGPVLGMAGMASYDEVVVSIVPGDTLAIFTDGLTEVGPDRRKMLDIEGVKVVFARQSAREAGPIVSEIISAVEQYAGAEVRDDQCLLVAVFR